LLILHVAPRKGHLILKADCKLARISHPLPGKPDVENQVTGKIAIIGGGVAGLTAGYLLHDRYDVTLFEMESRLGGNAYTLDTKTGEEIDISVFFYSRLEYPNFCRLLTKLGIRSTTWPMEGLSQSFRNLGTGRTHYLSCDTTRPATILSLKNFRSLFHQAIVFWNYNKGTRLSKAGQFKDLTLRQALAYLPALKGDTAKLAIFPVCLMTSMYWNELMEAPAEFVFAKIDRQFGSLRKFLSWRLFPCKTRDYVEKLAAPFRDRIRLNAPVRSVSRAGNSVSVKLDDGVELKFDKVIFACPADRALALIEESTDDEKRLLGAWRYNDGLVVVHTDSSAYPPENMWAMYSYLYSDEGGEIDTSINAHYRFQNGVPDSSRYIGTQYPNIRFGKEWIEFQKVFRTPVYDRRSTASIEELPSLNGKLNSFFCGSHFGYGLHEDAVTSAVNVGKMLGADWDEG
jgi:predicted NAD/FAD-binding protein